MHYILASLLAAIIIAASLPVLARDYNPRALNQYQKSERSYRGGYNRDIVRSDAYRDQRYEYLQERELDQRELRDDLADNRRLYEQNRIDKDEYERNRNNLRDEFRDNRMDDIEEYRNQRQERGEYKSKSSWN